ncbi:MAG: type II toxin-antitoxin system PemK/MazF family toxin [Syntrophobacteraceae bacterium]|jgi:mRNA interferase MazF
MKRGELYRVPHPSKSDPRKHRTFVIVSRQLLIDSQSSTVICAPIYTAYDGLATQVPIGPDDGLKNESSIHCDQLVSLEKARLTNFVGTLQPAKLEALKQALLVALDILD